MSAHRAVRPGPSEFAAFYAGYVARVPEGDIVATLTADAHAAHELLRDVSDTVAAQAYAPGKWTLKEVVLHCADAERIFAYRALRIARGDTTPLPGWDETAYAPLSGAADRTLPSILEEFQSVRRATVTLLAGLPVDAWMRRGSASGHEVTVRGLAWMTAGHLAHHLQIVRERYL